MYSSRIHLYVTFLFGDTTRKLTLDIVAAVKNTRICMNVFFFFFNESRIISLMHREVRVDTEFDVLLNLLKNTRTAEFSTATATLC